MSKTVYEAKKKPTVVAGRENVKKKKRIKPIVNAKRNINM